MARLFAHERRSKILEILQKQQRATVKELSKTLGVSEATLRTDLSALEKEGLLIRTHGGAMIDNRIPSEKSFSERERRNRHEKILIGRKALELVENNQCILLDASSTALELARALKQTSMRLTVVTNGITTALELKDNPSITVILIGGTLRVNSVAVEGILGRQILEQIHVDTMFASASGFTIQEGLTDFNVYEVELKKLMVASADKLVALLDHTKIGKSSIAQFAEPSDIDILITDNKTPPEQIEKIEKQNIKVLVV